MYRWSYRLEFNLELICATTSELFKKLKFSRAASANAISAFWKTHNCNTSFLFREQNCSVVRFMAVCFQNSYRHSVNIFLFPLRRLVYVLGTRFVGKYIYFFSLFLKLFGSPFGKYLFAISVIKVNNISQQIEASRSSFTLPFASIPSQNWPSFVIGMKWTNSDSFVLNLPCDWQKNVGWPQLSSLRCNFLEGLYLSNRHSGVDSSFLFPRHGIWILFANLLSHGII